MKEVIEVEAALRLALEVLEEIALAGMSGTGQESKEGMTEWHARQAWKFISIAARALGPIRDVLAQQSPQRSEDTKERSDWNEQVDEPVAWMQNTTCGLYVIDHPDEWHCIPLYTTPPQRPSRSDMTWVGLTPQERDEINEQVYGAVPHHVAFHAAIESKLREKNSL